MRKPKHFIRLLRIIIAMVVTLIGAYQASELHRADNTTIITTQPVNSSPAAIALSQLPIKGRAPKTGYTRSMFSDGWGYIMNCDVRNYILGRDLSDIIYVPQTCKVNSGTLNDPYTSSRILFLRGPTTSDDIQIDHVVSLSDAWQKGAQLLSPAQRYTLANDPLNLLAVQGDANQQKGDGDAATWLPPNKAYRCPYVARQIAVKTKYSLWLTKAEYQAIATVLAECPNEPLPQSTDVTIL